MKSVLISIQPKWCELIANGTKTVEVRKTFPKVDAPFKVYIYCTHSKSGNAFCKGNDILNGKVIGEFVCNEIYWLIQAMSGIVIADMDWCVIDPDWFREASCLTDEEICNYLKDNDGYGWLISDLVIYDKPKELSEFHTRKKCDSCKSGYESTACIYDEKCRVPSPITRPPQSWCYVERRC